MSEAELEVASYKERQEKLKEFLDQKLLTQQEYNTYLEKMQTDHQAKMSEIDVYRYGTALQQAGAFFGDMASAMQGGNEKMLRIAKVFGAAESVVNAWRAYSQVASDPTLPWWAKIPKALGVLSSVMGAANAIRGVSAGGGGGSAATSSGTAVSPAQPLQATLNLQGPFAQALTGALGPLLDGLNREAGDRGYQLMTRAAA